MQNPTRRKVTLRRVPAPHFAFPDPPPPIPPAEYESRLAAAYAGAGADWLVVYGDREHSANLVYLVNYDPRFEEALLLLGPGGRRYLVVGNEGMGYLPIVPVPVEPLLCQTLSLGGQARSTAPRLLDVLRTAGIAPGQRVALAGWKYLEPAESDQPAVPAFVPAFMVDVLRRLVGSNGALVDTTAVLMHPAHGLRARNSAAQIAAFEWGARSASAAVFAVMHATQPGVTEREAMTAMRYAGDPLSVHPILTSGAGAVNGLRSPSARRLASGDAVSVAIAYWGSLCCRAGLLLAEPDRAFFDELAAPYFDVIATWYRTLRIGATGQDVFAAVAQAFAGRPFASALNPGHLVSFEEWMHTPIRPDSPEQIASGMVFQCDIIPSPLPPGRLMNCEDTVAVADEALRAEIAAAYPDLWARVEARRRLMTEQLGLTLADELLPLSDGAAYLPPFWLASDLVCTLAD